MQNRILFICSLTCPSSKKLRRVYNLVRWIRQVCQPGNWPGDLGARDDLYLSSQTLIGLYKN